MKLFQYLLAEPAPLVAWVFWLVAVNTASVFFLRRVEARWVLAAWLLNVVLMSALVEVNGYNRFLGFSHIVAWTPLLVYLHRRRDRLSGDRLFDGWVRTLFVSDFLSLIVDYVGVVRYFVEGRG